MPAIPIYRQQTTVDTGVNLGRVDAGAATAPSRALEQAGQMATEYEQERRNEFNNLRAEDAFNKLRERQMSLMLDPEKGFAAVKSKDAVQRPLMKEYGDQFQQAQNEIAGTLQNDDQRRLFQRRAASAGAEFQNALMRHVLEQSNQYREQVFSGTLSVETNRAATEWNNPLTVQGSLERITDAVAARAKADGLGADATDALLRDSRSKVHATVIAAALENQNVGYAEQYLQANASQMTALDKLRVQGQVKKEADTRYALGAATSVVTSAMRQAEPGDFGRLWNLVEARESGGKQDAVSPKGAVGVAQVMPTTGPEAAKLAGMPWDESRFRTDAEYNRKLGQAYFVKQLDTFNGDVSKALAAYNAGPGAVDKAVKDAATAASATGESALAGDWLSLLPKETQDYVAAIAPKYQGGGGAPTRPTLEQIHEQVRARVGDTNPERLKLALDESTRQWNDANNARKQREDELTGQAFKLIEQNGGRWDALPASMKAALPGDKFGALREYAAKVAKGEPIETDWDAYYQLRTSPGLLRQTNLLALKNRLADGEFKELARQQEELQNGSASSTQLQTVNQRMGVRFAEMGVDATPKPGTDDAKKVSQVWAILDQRVRVAEAAAGRKLKPEEMDNEVDKLFTQVDVKGKLWGANKRRAFELKPDDQIVVPDAERKQIMAALQKSGQPVTEERLLYYYKRARGLQ